MNLLSDILQNGELRSDRTQTGTKSLFAKQLTFSLEQSFPLLTTKKVFFRGIVEELLWFISGKTDGQVLLEKKVHIWEKNGTRSFLDSCGLVGRKEHDLGPIYGHQWRHSGAPYKTCTDDYTGQGVDQLAQVIHLLKTDPFNRRIILSAWNPQDIPSMALPPCHAMCQFYAETNNGDTSKPLLLSCQMYQRSADIGLGVPFNIAQYALLTYFLAQVCGMQPHKLLITFGDAHIYQNHVEALKSQLQRTPKPFPRLILDSSVNNIEDFQMKHISLVDYEPYESIAMPMAV